MVATWGSPGWSDKPIGTARIRSDQEGSSGSLPYGAARVRAEYEAVAVGAGSVAELREISIQYLSRLREDLLSRVERARTDANRRRAEADRVHLEASRLRETLQQLVAELELRSSRLARGDLQDLRTMAVRGLQTPCNPPPRSPALSPRSLLGSTTCDSGVCLGLGRRSADALPAESGQGSSEDLRPPPILKKLRARIELLEKNQKRLEKENESLRSARLESARETRSRRGRVPAVASAAHAATDVSPRTEAMSSTAPAARHSTVIEPVDDRASGLAIPDEKEKWLAAVRRLEKEQADQQQYADQVANELSNALRALEVENGSLQDELRQSKQRLSSAGEGRRHLEGQIRQLRAEKDALTREMVELRSAHHSSAGGRDDGFMTDGSMVDIRSTHHSSAGGRDDVLFPDECGIPASPQTDYSNRGTSFGDHSLLQSAVKVSGLTSMWRTHPENILGNHSEAFSSPTAEGRGSVVSASPVSQIPRLALTLPGLGSDVDPELGAREAEDAPSLESTPRSQAHLPGGGHQELALVASPQGNSTSSPLAFRVPLASITRGDELQPGQVAVEVLSVGDFPSTVPSPLTGTSLGSPTSALGSRDARVRQIVPGDSPYFAQQLRKVRSFQEAMPVAHETSMPSGACGEVMPQGSLIALAPDDAIIRSYEFASTKNTSVHQLALTERASQSRWLGGSMPMLAVGPEQRTSADVIRQEDASFTDVVAVDSPGKLVSLRNQHYGVSRDTLAILGPTESALNSGVLSLHRYAHAGAPPMSIEEWSGSSPTLTSRQLSKSMMSVSDTAQQTPATPAWAAQSLPMLAAPGPSGLTWPGDLEAASFGKSCV